METDFLNFRDGEYFNTNLYQNDLLDDSQSSLLDVMGDGYSGHNADYIDHSIIWEQDLERELNGDIALIPMSGYIDSIPKLSNSPPSKDFHRMFTDLQDHLASIESADNDELDLRIPDHNLTVDMFECLHPVKQEPESEPELKPEPEPELKPEPGVSRKMKIVHPVRKGGKNLELLKAVVEKEMKMETEEFHDDLDNENFDITSYVNGDKIKTEVISDDDAKDCSSSEEMSSDESDKKNDKFVKSSCHQEIKLKVENDSDDDCIDIETVSDQMPVLEARDLTSLLEQFEASEAVNPNKSKHQNPDIKTPEIKTSEIKTSEVKIPEKKFDKVEKVDKYRKPVANVEVKKHPDTISDELIQKLKASGLKKQISVIPAIPKKTKRDKNKLKPPKPDTGAINSPASVPNGALKPCQSAVPSAVQSAQITIPNRNQVMKSQTAPNLSKGDCVPASVLNAKRSMSTDSSENSSDVSSECNLSPNKNTTKLSVDNSNIFFDHDYCRSSVDPKSNDDAHNRIKNAIINQSIKQKINIVKSGDSLLKNRTLKSSDGKIMVSLLKNNRNNITANGNTVVNTLNANDEQVQNIIIDPKTSSDNSYKQDAKKRKLNLEEYKKLRGEVIKSRSTESSRAASPVSGAGSPRSDTTQDKVKSHQELMMKMASEILKTPVKSKMTSELSLEVFVPPDAVKKPVEVKTEKQEPVAETPVVKNNDFEMKTIVSIGVNTIERMKRHTPVDVLPAVVKGTKLNDLTPILQNASSKINSNSLIANITATLLQQKPAKLEENHNEKPSNTEEHGEDKTVIILYKNRQKPLTRNVEVQTDEYHKEKSGRSSSASSSNSVSSKGTKPASRRKRTSSSNSVSSSLGSRYSRSKSRSRSDSESSDSSYSSSSSCSRSRSVSPSRRYASTHTSRSRHQYSRTRRRSRSNNYRDNYKRSRSPFQNSWQRRRSRESAERERQREVEERRVIYVGNIEDGMSKAELRRRFQRFGPITNVSVHFREHGDNYGFVTFAYKVDAYEAVENGNDDPDQVKYDISFGGRRAFCKTRYSDLDNIEDEVANPLMYRKEEDSFDILLRELQAKLLRKKKV